MKKLLYLAIAFTTAGFASCGYKNAVYADLGDTVAVDTLPTAVPVAKPDTDTTAIAK